LKENRLFALPYSTENVGYAASFRFARVTPGYILIYTDKSRAKPPNGRGVRVAKQDLHRLTKQDEAWLLDCAMTLLVEHTRESDAKRLSDMVDDLEVELERVMKDEPE
jgi:hypothetical protein